MVVLCYGKMGASWRLKGSNVERLVRWDGETGLARREGLEGGFCEEVGEPGKVVGYFDGVILDGCGGREAALWFLRIAPFRFTSRFKLRAILWAFACAGLSLCILTMPMVGILKRWRRYGPF